jgi:uncharacterized protein
MGDSAFLRQIDPVKFTDANFGLPTVQDVLSELEKPGRDPRPEFKTASFLEGVEDIQDLKANMVLEGVVTNVTNFGIFVDIGVHQDGLVHISAMSEQFIKDPRDLVKAGNLVQVKVLDVDLERRRIALTMRLAERTEGKSAAAATKEEKRRTPRERPVKSGKNKNRNREQASASRPAAPPPGGAMAEAFSRALKGC